MARISTKISEYVLFVHMGDFWPACQTWEQCWNWTRPPVSSTCRYSYPFKHIADSYQVSTSVKLSVNGCGINHPCERTFDKTKHIY